MLYVRLQRRMSLVGLNARTKTANFVREFLQTRGFEEFIPQLMAKTQPTEPAIFQFKADNFYLATSPEGFLKKAMAEGAGNCFAISHCFRTMEGENYLHRPDFLMAEFYLKNANYKNVMQILEELISKFLDTKLKIQSVSILDLWQKYLKVDLRTLNLEEFAKVRGYNPLGATWEQLFYQIHINEIEKYYPSEPFFLVDFPAKISPLCKARESDPKIAERFELLINKIELADGNSENFNYLEVERMMKDECFKRNTPLDKGFINALKKLQGESWAGVGLGLDRLAMLTYNIKDIEDITGDNK